MADTITSLACSVCRYEETRSSHRRWYEYPLGLIGLHPFRCLSCQQRFFRWAARR